VGRIPVYVLTSSVNREDIKRAEAFGVRDFLPKPFTAEQIGKIRQQIL
jgi:CheY-like chemotaxis protein